MEGVTNRCSQFLRHFARYIKRDTLDKWGVRYTLVRQLPGEVIMTFPKVYHQGFSTGSTVAEAINYAGEDWSTDGYRFCSSSCPEGSIPEDKLALRGEDEPQEGPDIDDISSDEAEDEQEDEEGETEDDTDEQDDDSDEPAEDKDESEEDEPDSDNPKKRSKKGKGSASKKPKNAAAQAAAKKGQLTKLRNSVGLANVRLPRDFIPLDVVNASLPSATDPHHRHTILRLVCQIGSPQAILDLRNGWDAQRLTTSSSRTTPMHPLLALHYTNQEIYKLYIRRHYLLADVAKRYRDAYKSNKNNKALPPPRPRPQAPAQYRLRHRAARRHGGARKAPGRRGPRGAQGRPAVQDPGQPDEDAHDQGAQVGEAGGRVWGWHPGPDPEGRHRY